MATKRAARFTHDLRVRPATLPHDLGGVAQAPWGCGKKSDCKAVFAQDSGGAILMRVFPSTGEDLHAHQAVRRGLFRAVTLVVGSQPRELRVRGADALSALSTPNEPFARQTHRQEADTVALESGRFRGALQLTSALNCDVCARLLVSANPDFVGS